MHLKRVWTDVGLRVGHALRGGVMWAYATLGLWYSIHPLSLFLLLFLIENRFWWNDLVGFDYQLFVVVVLLFYVHGKHLRSCRDGQLT